MTIASLVECEVCGDTFIVADAPASAREGHLVEAICPEGNGLRGLARVIDAGCDWRGDWSDDD